MKFAGIITIILALVIGIVPLITDCQSQGRAIDLGNGKTTPMKCHWTALAELAMSGPLLALGGLFLANKRQEAVRSLAVLGIILGVFTILLPSVLIGVCTSNMMLCNTLMKPTLNLAGILIITASLIAIVTAGQRSAELVLGDDLPA